MRFKQRQWTKRYKEKKPEKDDAQRLRVGTGGVISANAITGSHIWPGRGGEGRRTEGGQKKSSDIRIEKTTQLFFHW